MRCIALLLLIVFFLSGELALAEQKTRITLHSVKGESSLSFKQAKTDISCLTCEVRICRLLGKPAVVTKDSSLIKIWHAAGPRGWNIVGEIPLSTEYDNGELHCGAVTHSDADSIVLWLAKERRLVVIDQLGSESKTIEFELTEASTNSSFALVSNGRFALFDATSPEIHIWQYGSGTQNPRWLWSLGNWPSYARLVKGFSSQSRATAEVYLHNESHGALFEVGFKDDGARTHASRPFHARDLGSEVLPVLGDFNGDGFLDALLSRPSPMGFYALAGSELGMTPVPVGGLPSEASLLATGDLTGDGQEDILALVGVESNELILFSSTSHPELSQETLEIDNVSDTANLKDIRESLLLRVTDMPEYFRYVAEVYRSGEGLAANVIHYPKNDFRGQPIDVGARLSDRLPGPFACSGFNPLNVKLFGWARHCPAGYAVFALDDGGNWSDHGEWINHPAVCCRLPRADLIDTSKPVQTQDLTCPKNHIVVGLEPDSAGETEKVLCAPLNEEKYRLESPLAGSYWGIGASQDIADTTLDLTRVPAALRLGLQRQRRDSIDIDGCISSTPGAVLVARKKTKFCADAVFSQIIEVDGEKPLEMFYPCTLEPDPFIPSLGCK